MMRVNDRDAEPYMPNDDNVQPEFISVFPIRFQKRPSNGVSSTELIPGMIAASDVFNTPLLFFIFISIPAWKCTLSRFTAHIPSLLLRSDLICPSLHAVNDKKLIGLLLVPRSFPFPVRYSGLSFRSYPRNPIQYTKLYREKRD